MYLILHSYRTLEESTLHSYRTLEESTLYCILTGQYRKVPYIAFLQDNGGQYFVLHSYRTMKEIPYIAFLPVNGGQYLTLESTLYCILTGQWRIVPYFAILQDNAEKYIAFLPENTGKYLILHSYRTLEEHTLYCILIGRWGQLNNVLPDIEYLLDNGSRHDSVCLPDWG